MNHWGVIKGNNHWGEHDVLVILGVAFESARDQRSKASGFSSFPAVSKIECHPCGFSFSVTKLARSVREWCSRLKWLATGFSSHWWLMLERWTFILMWSAFSVSSTYWMLHFRHWVLFLVLQSAVAFVLKVLPVVLLENVSVGLIWRHILQQGWPHWLLPIYEKCGRPNLALNII